MRNNLQKKNNLDVAAADVSHDALCSVVSKGIFCFSRVVLQMLMNPMLLAYWSLVT